MAYYWQWYGREIIYAIAVGIVSLIFLIKMNFGREF